MGSSLWDLVIDSTGDTLYITDRGPDVVVVYDVATQTIVTTVEEDLEELECPQKCTDEDKLQGKCHPMCPEEKPYDFYMLCADTKTVGLGMRPYASHGWSSFSTPVDVPAVPTEVRFCAKNPQLGITCLDPTEDFFEDQMLGESGCWDPNPLVPTLCADPEMPEDHYRRITFASGQANGPDPNGAAAHLDYDRGAHTYGAATVGWDWHVESDFDRWVNGTSLPLVADPAAHNMVGTIWVSAETPVGATIDVGTGIHAAGLDNAQLANHHNLGWDEQGIDLGWELDPCTVFIPKPVPVTLGRRTDRRRLDGRLPGSVARARPIALSRLAHRALEEGGEAAPANERSARREPLRPRPRRPPQRAERRAGVWRAASRRPRER